MMNARKIQRILRWAVVSVAMWNVSAAMAAECELVRASIWKAQVSAVPVNQVITVMGWGRENLRFTLVQDRVSPDSYDERIAVHNLVSHCQSEFWFENQRYVGIKTLCGDGDRSLEISCRF